MSPNQQPSGYNPSRERKNAFKEFQAMGLFFKDFLAENQLVKWSIVAAGVGAVFETGHIIWLFAVWLYWKLAH
jgi:hypothetical protein